MTGYLAVDLILAVILLLFARAGAKKGLVLTLCSLIAVVVALLAASLAADLLTPLAVDMAAPKLTSRVEEKLTEQLPEGSVPSTEGLRERIDGLRLPEPIKETLRETLARFREGTDSAIREVSAAMARSLAEVVLYFLLF
ncbi:MAG: hypothetical protein GX585_02405, partial [Clostridiales bacterium]|nr:hypothetical protein [Clostridiales bacterium]